MGFFEYLASRWKDLLELSVEHAQVVLVSLLIATVIGVSLGVLTYRRPAAAQAVLAVASAILTMPSFALFGLLIPVLGLGYTPTVVALSCYAVPSILRNTITGLQSMDPAARRATSRSSRPASSTSAPTRATPATSARCSSPTAASRPSA